MLAENLARVHERIAQACQRCGRDPASVTLICVTKGVPADTVGELIRLGVRDIGENRVQEAREKIQAVAASQVRWHLIGHLQRNKAKDALALFAMIHSVDSAALAQELQRHAAAQDRTVDVLVQVNVSGEATKSGCAISEAAGLARHVMGLGHLKLRGLMAIPPLTEDPEQARPHFRKLRALRDELSPELKLSIGMSGDFEVAIEEGADFVRVGTAIVGPGETGH